MQPNETTRPFASDDPRHGTTAGYSAHQRTDKRPCEPCRHAASTYAAKRVHDARNGISRTVSPIGFRRRAEALQALGWSLNVIAAKIPMRTTHLAHTMRRATYLHIERHEQMVAVYDELSMTVPTDSYASRRRTIAARKGYVPPLAWDDIDHDPEPHIVREKAVDLVDEVKVRRVLDGIRQDCTAAERVAVIEAWTGPLNELERVTGWNIRRMTRKAVA